MRTYAFWKTKALRVLSIFVTLGLLMSGSVSAASSPGGRWLWQASAPSHETNAAANGAIAGTVRKSPDSAPIAGALVVAHSGPELFYSATTDSQGAYSFMGLMPGTYEVSATASGYAAATRGNIVVTANTTARVDFALEVAAPSQFAGSLTGQVRAAATGQGIGGATVLLLQSSAVLQGALADTNGLYLFSEVSAGAYNALAFAPGYLASSQGNIVINANATARVDFSLALVPAPLKGSIAGRITSAATGAAIQGAQIDAKAGTEVVASASSNANGDYTLTDLIVGSYTLQVSASGFQTAAQDTVVVSRNATTTVNFVLQLLPLPPPATGSLTGRVVDAANGKPIGGAVEVLKQKASINPFDRSEELVLQATTEADGKYSFAQVEPGIYKLKVSAEGYHSTKIDGIAILASETTVVNVALRPREEAKRHAGRGAIAGIVANAESGKPIEGAVVFFTPSHGQDKNGHDRRFARTDKDGKYKLEGVLIGTYQLHARAKGYKPAKEEDLQVQADLTTTANLELRAVPQRDSKDRADADDAREKAKERAEKAKEKAERDDDNGHHQRGRVQLETSGELHAALSAPALVPSLVAVRLSF